MKSLIARFRLQRGLWVFAVACLVSLATGARAEELSAKEEAQQVFQQGVIAADEQRWADAERHFTRALVLAKSPATLLNLALVRYELNAPLEAVSALDELDRMTMSDAVRKGAAALRQQLEPLVARGIVRSNVASWTLQVDGGTSTQHGAHAQIVLLPGEHTLQLTAPGYAPQTLRLRATAGIPFEAAVTLEGLPGPVSREPTADAIPLPSAGRNDDHAPVRARQLWRNPWLWTAVGLVVVGGAVTSGLLLSREPAAHERSPDTGSTGLVF